jgi:hypothetical protein
MMCPRKLGLVRESPELTDMDLTSQQVEAIDHGAAVPIVVEGRSCVVLRQDVYDRVKRVTDFDDSDISPEETYAAVLAAWDQEDDPGLDAYQDFKQR